MITNGASTSDKNKISSAISALIINENKESSAPFSADVHFATPKAQQHRKGPTGSRLLQQSAESRFANDDGTSAATQHQESVRLPSGQGPEGGDHPIGPGRPSSPLGDGIQLRTTLSLHQTRLLHEFFRVSSDVRSDFFIGVPSECGRLSSRF